MFYFYGITVLIGLLIYYFVLRDNIDRSDEPPGPKVWPVVGNLIQLFQAEGNITQKLGNLGKKYGEIYSLKVGLKRVVVITSKEAISTILTNDAAFGRDLSGTFHDRTSGKNLGIVTGEGEMWEKSRTWTFKTLKEFGFGKSSEMENFVQTCSESLISEINSKISTSGSGLVPVTQLFSSAIYTIMWQMIEGRIKPGDEEDIKMLVIKSDAFIRSRSRGSGIVNSFPFLRFVFPQMLGYYDQMDFFNSCNKVAGKLYLEAAIRLKSNPTSTPTNLVESFVKNFKQDEKIFSCENFQIVFQDLLIGSTDTSSSLMECIVLYLITYPEVQEKIYAEILAIQEGEEKFISFSDRKRMPYTQAFLLELHRNAKILQNSVPRKALWDFKYKNYVIKKDTVILTDTRLYYEDKTIWTDPEVFRPERFINEKGEICNTGSIISFSVGKRNCPGELYANLVTFLLTTILVQRYELSVPNGEDKPRLDLRPGFAFKPHPFKAVFRKR